MITQADVRATLAQMRKESPGFRLRRKPGHGRCGPLIGAWFFVSGAWEQYPPWRQYLILRHEWVHLRQYRRFGLGCVWLGVLPMVLAYLALPLPMGFAWCRYAMERAAFRQEMAVWAALHGRGSLLQRRAYYIAQLTGRAYWWAWPWRRSVARWVDRALGETIHRMERA